MKTLKYAALVVSLLAMLLLGCQIGRNIMVTKASATYTSKGVKDPTIMMKQIDDFIAEVDQKGSVDVAELKNLLMAMREFISEYAKNNNVTTETQRTQRSTK
ncbi:MAG: hypothetical protein V1709_06700 [Planctomycetota bacterium]